MKAYLGWALGAIGLLWFSTSARAWDPFTLPNPRVEEGNRAMAQNQAEAAIRAYAQAARDLPAEPRVHLNRGLALLKKGDLEPAAAAFLEASTPPAPREVRADAFYNMGIAFYRTGDAAAKEEAHDEAQRAFREAVDAFRRSLRARPGNRDAAWNLELARRRLQESEQEQDQQDQNQEQQQDQDQDQDQEQQQDQSQQDPSNDPDDPEGTPEDQAQDSDPDSGNEGNSAENEPSPSDSSKDPPDESQRPESSAPQDQARDNPTKPQGHETPADVARVLDALQNNEENLQRHRARVRGMRENRRPVKDW